MSTGDRRDALTALRHTLRHLGYPPVPVTSPWHKRTRSPGKAPLLPEWQNVCRTAGEPEIASWSLRPDEGNTGILCGDAVGIDVDILDAELGNKIEVHVRTRLGETPLRRIGLPPKRLLVFRTDVPFTKKVTTEFRIGGKKALVEALGEGQQFVAFGGHPSGCDYTWTGDTPLQMALSDLPTITAEQCRQFLDECEIIMAAAGAVADGTRQRARHHYPPREPGADTHRPGWCGNPATRPPRALVLEALAFVPNSDIGYHDWISLGYSLYAALGPKGADVWAEWSGQYAANDAATSASKWASFGNIRLSTHRTLFAWAERCGWDGWPAHDRESAAADVVAVDAARLFAEAVPVAGTPAEKYLRARAIPPNAWPDAIVRWHPHERMVMFAARDAAAQVVAVQRVFLDRDGAPLTDGAAR